MAIYTCFDMIRDCKANKPHGWSYFITNFLPVCRRLIEHYYPERSDDRGLVGRVLQTLRDSAASLFQALEPMNEREFACHLRPYVLAAVEKDRSGRILGGYPGLGTFAGALLSLTVIERQIVWLETMSYDETRTAGLLRVSPETVAAVRQKAGELLLAKGWSRAMTNYHGAALSRAVASAQPAEPLPAKIFLDAIDGRITWARRQDMELRLAESWYEIDHFCRVREADSAIRNSTPLTETEAAPFRQLLGLPSATRPLWKRMFASG